MWLVQNAALVAELFGRHVLLSVTPLVLGLLLSIPLGWLAVRFPRSYAPIIAVTSLFFTIPSLALFVVLPALLGTGNLSALNVVAALTIYTVALLVRTVADGLKAVDDDVLQAATAMGYRRLPRLLTVELPIAVPVLAAGLRVAAVTNVSLVSVAALIGIPQLGQLLTDGYQRRFAAPLVTGIVLAVLLALALDFLILRSAKALTPWRVEVRA